MSNFELNEPGESNIITVDPDAYSRKIQREAFFRRLLDGDRSESLRAIHYALTARWNWLGETEYEALRDLFYANALAFWDDGDVPPLVETKTIYDTASYTHAGITNPSSTHKAYTDSSSSLPSAEGDFETTEVSTVYYGNISADDSNTLVTENPTADYYLYHKFLLLSGIDQGDVQRIRVQVAALSPDGAPANKDGVVLYAWNQSNWEELKRTTSSAKTYLNWSTADETIAQSLVDSDDNYIRLLLRSRNARDGTNILSLWTYYVIVEVNEGLSLIVSLSHTPVLSGGDVIWVKNNTDVTTLTLTTDYTISGSDVTIIGEDPGDEIEVKYNREFECMIAEIYEEWHSGDPSSDRNRQLRLVLETLGQGVVGS